MNATKAIEAIAKERKMSVKQVRSDMIVAIHKTYLAKKPEFTIIFGDREPSPEEFLEVMAKEVLDMDTILLQ
ncbi:MAG: hypothetical protein IJI53_14250 [Clostridia bacterium]|nr:hypothetical protein [Clostridia bacterium]